MLEQHYLSSSIETEPKTPNTSALLQTLPELHLAIPQHSPPPVNNIDSPRGSVFKQVMQPDEDVQVTDG